MIQHSTGRYVVYSEEFGFLLRSIDAWGKIKPEFVQHPDYAIGLKQSEAREQINFLSWAPWKMKNVKLSKR